ncbi:MAG: PEP-CTERM sorting domain-containing protein [Gemmatimonadetes bacterium]|nr:PEP-CTERM sorting domain-containing protein [Gemmatimonadota bacterium]
MRSSLTLAAALLAAPLPLLADGWSLSGCGATFGTCAAAQVTAVQTASGRWQLEITVSNNSYDAGTAAYRNALLTELRLRGVGGADFLGATTGDGTDWSNNFREHNGNPDYTVQGIQIDRRNGQVIWQKQWGASDPDCTADAGCDALTPSNTPDHEFNYFSGPVTFRFEVDTWDDNSQIAVFQGRVGGKDGQEELYWLDNHGTTVTPEPGTMALLASGLAGMALKRKRRPTTTA